MTTTHAALSFSAVNRGSLKFLVRVKQASLDGRNPIAEPIEIRGWQRGEGAALIQEGGVGGGCWRRG